MNGLVIEHVIKIDDAALKILQEVLKLIGNNKNEVIKDTISSKSDNNIKLDSTDVDTKNIDSTDIRPTFEELRAKLSAITKTGAEGKDKVKALLNAFGVKKLTEVKTEDYIALMAKIKEVK